MSYRNRPLARERKADGTVVTEADKAVDRLLAARLKDARPDYGWLSEESLENERRLSARRVWILDPIDGTRDFRRGGDGLDRRPLPCRGWRPGSFRRGQPGARRIFRGAGGRGGVSQWPAHLRKRAKGTCRRAGRGFALAAREGKWRPPWPGAVPVGVNSSIYRLALIASGHADASFALNPKWEWDIAAGALLVSEAGGTVTGKTGAPLTFNSAEAKVAGLVAAAPGLHRILIERLR